MGAVQLYRSLYSTKKAAVMIDDNTAEDILKTNSVSNISPHHGAKGGKDEKHSQFAVSEEDLNRKAVHESSERLKS